MEHCTWPIGNCVCHAVVWIDVKERLPDPDQEVVITGWRRNVSGLRFFAIAVHSVHEPGTFFDLETGDTYYPPTHWFAMPVIPEQEGR